MKRLKISGLILGILAIPFFIFILDVKFNCIFKKYLYINCPGCGLTRAFNELFNLNIINSLEYNILAIPIAILTIVLIIFLINDLIKNSDDNLNKIFKFLNKYKFIVIIIIVIMMLLNNYVTTN